MSRSAPRSSCCTACRSSRFLPLTRSWSPWIWAWTPLGPSSRMSLAICLALSDSIPCLMRAEILYDLPEDCGSSASSDLSEMPRLISFSLKTSSAAVTRSSVSACSVTPSSPAHAIVALVPRKSKRCESSLPAWFRALSTSCRSTLLTTSKDASAIADSLPLLGRARGSGTPSTFLYAAPVPPHGGLPEWPMGADCKSVGLAYEGSNPSPATHGTTAPDPARSGAVAVRWLSRSQGRRPRARGGGAFQLLAAEEQPAEGDVHVAGAADRDLGAVGLGRPGVQRRPAVGELVGHGRLGCGAGERQLVPHAGGVEDRLVGVVGRGEGGAVAHRLHLLLLQERVGGGDRTEDHQGSDQPADQDEGQRRAPLAHLPVSLHGGQRTERNGCPPPVDSTCGHCGHPIGWRRSAGPRLWTTATPKP